MISVEPFYTMNSKTESFVEIFELEAPRSDSKSRIAMISTHGYGAGEPPLAKPDTGGQVVYVIEFLGEWSRLGEYLRWAAISNAPFSGNSGPPPFSVWDWTTVIQAGDPDWNAYYMLNLPYHYHNGGIWPFVGIMQIQFIHKLGFDELAMKELLRLALLDESGLAQPREFNEWAHGQTGEPMGKVFQTWSCSEFIKSCYLLKIA